MSTSTRSSSALRRPALPRFTPTPYASSPTPVRAFEGGSAAGRCTGFSERRSASHAWYAPGRVLALPRTAFPTDSSSSPSPSHPHLLVFPIPIPTAFSYPIPIPIPIPSPPSPSSSPSPSLSHAHATHRRSRGAEYNPGVKRRRASGLSVDGHRSALIHAGLAFNVPPLSIAPLTTQPCRPPSSHRIAGPAPESSSRLTESSGPRSGSSHGQGAGRAVVGAAVSGEGAVRLPSIPTEIALRAALRRPRTPISSRTPNRLRRAEARPAPDARRATVTHLRTPARYRALAPSGVAPGPGTGGQCGLLTYAPLCCWPWPLSNRPPRRPEGPGGCGVPSAERCPPDCCLSPSASHQCLHLRREAATVTDRAARRRISRGARPAKRTAGALLRLGLQQQAIACALCPARRSAFRCALAPSGCARCRQPGAAVMEKRDGRPQSARTCWGGGHRRRDARCVGRAWGEVGADAIFAAVRWQRLCLFVVRRVGAGAELDTPFTRHWILTAYSSRLISSAPRLDTRARVGRAYAEEGEMQSLAPAVDESTRTWAPRETAITNTHKSRHHTDEHAALSRPRRHGIRAIAARCSLAVGQNAEVGQRGG
ncbi:hypothetical protein HYPSUDRAFT_216186 [Hypholoma sublateritium FD-334 SS-4]|uniref:Uncharacterized protein n=1 Tax=Hypholoma sublateritium (strain FD-334 SS-4) TaxID=945553 RepID=A0A0D2MDQ0_HYPSF|nr:hypothetical protein HYPSUDRAFT_216186 [Hypholoma sublateritium FD-334 SS-4]